MKSAKRLIGTAVMKEAYQYMAHDPIEKLPRFSDWAKNVIVQKAFRAAINPLYAVITLK